MDNRVEPSRRPPTRISLTLVAAVVLRGEPVKRKLQDAIENRTFDDAIDRAAGLPLRRADLNANPFVSWHFGRGAACRVHTWAEAINGTYAGQRQ